MDPELRTPRETAYRSCCLAAVIARAQAEAFLASGESDPGFESYFDADLLTIPDKINQWLEREELMLSLSPKETSAMQKRPGTWTSRERIDGSWRREALTVLEWALGILEPMPAADSCVAAEDVLEAAYLMEETSGFRDKAKLRRPDAIVQARDTAEFWLWRCRASKLQNESEEEALGRNVSKEERSRIVTRAAATGESRGLFRCIGSDFPAFGKPFRDLSEDEYQRIRSISTERLYGLNWLCNVDAPDSDNVETNT